MATVSTEGAPVRAAAARAVAAVFEGRNLDAALAQCAADINGADHALLQALAYGTIRDHRWLNALCGKLLRDLTTTAPLVASLVEIGLYQLRSTRVPPHAAVSATVSACALLDQSRARPVVNAVLRRYQRERARLEAALPGTPALRYSFPDWMAGTIRRDWPDNWRSLLAASNEPGPLTLRANRRRVSQNAILAALEQASIHAQPIVGAPDALRLDKPRPVDSIPRFKDGLLSVQDGAAQLAAPLLAVESGLRVLDACAAPGGKTAHLLETADNLDLLALDNDAARLARIDENLRRLGLHDAGHRIELRCADARQPDSWWDGKPFDRILLDAPCSGTGVIRRHPDIKWLRRDSDIRQLAGRQRTLLDALWPLLAPGGVLLFATCSMLDAEGSSVVEGFLRAHDDAREWSIDADWGEAARIGRRLAPGGNWDGFYYARIAKRKR